MSAFSKGEPCAPPVLTRLENRSGRPIPTGLERALISRRWAYSLIEHILFCDVARGAEDYLGVAGDGDNGCYEWFTFHDGVLKTSDCGYGDWLIALRDVLTQVFGKGEA